MLISKKDTLEIWEYLKKNFVSEIDYLVENHPRTWGGFNEMPTFRKRNRGESASDLFLRIPEVLDVRSFMDARDGKSTENAIDLFTVGQKSPNGISSLYLKKLAFFAGVGISEIANLGAEELLPKIMEKIRANRKAEYMLTCP